MVDLDHDGQPEVVLLVMPGYDDDFFNEKVHYLFLLKYTKTGKLKSYKIHTVEFECCLWSWGVDVLGFLGTQDKHTHLLINYSYPGNSTQSPILKIFDMQWSDVNKIGEFGGFYEHEIAGRIKDIDDNGNSEIIYVEDTYWPPGKSHAYIIPIYSIAEYRDDRYVEVNDKFRKETVFF